MATSHNVLIVEDEPLISMMLEDVLDGLGHRVVGICETVGEALVRIEEGGFDLAILDVNLKGDHVWPVADRLRELGVRLIIATGGHVDEPPAVHAAAPQLSKPYALDAVPRIIDEAMAPAL